MSPGSRDNKIIRIVFAYALLTCAVMIVCAGCRKDKDSKAKVTEFVVDNPYEQGPLFVRVRIEKKTMTIAETVLLNFEATIEPGYEVEFPEIGKVLVDFGIVDWKSFDDRLDENNNIVKSYQYRLEPFLSGNYQLPAFTFVFYMIFRTQNYCFYCCGSLSLRWETRFTVKFVHVLVMNLFEITNT